VAVFSEGDIETSASITKGLFSFSVVCVAITNQNLIQEEIERRLNSGNA
jgi:hypothetical protein